MLKIRSFAKRIFHFLGYSIERLENGEKNFDKAFGESEDLDLQVLLRKENSPIIFDVGANTGQSIDFGRFFRTQKFIPLSQTRFHLRRSEKTILVMDSTHMKLHLVTSLVRQNYT